MDPSAVNTAASSATQFLKTVALLGSTLSLTVGIAPILWGRADVKWMVTAISSAVIFAMAGTMISLFVPTDGAAPPPYSSRMAPGEIDWSSISHVVAILIGTMAALFLAGYGWNKVQSRRLRRQRQAEQIALATDPSAVVRQMLPDMTGQVDEALARIARLEELRPRIGRAEDMEALVLIEKRVPSVMGLYAKASAASTELERTELARTALGSIIDIGRMAEDARQRIAGDLRTELDTESRYISSRTGGSDALRLD